MVLVVAGGNGVGSQLNQFGDISGIYIDDDENIYISDQVNDRVVKWEPGASKGAIDCWRKWKRSGH